MRDLIRDANYCASAANLQHGLNTCVIDVNATSFGSSLPYRPLQGN